MDVALQFTRVLAWPVALIVVGLMLWAAIRNPRSKFKVHHGPNFGVEFDKHVARIGAQWGFVADPLTVEQDTRFLYDIVEEATARPTGIEGWMGFQAACVSCARSLGALQTRSLVRADDWIAALQGLKVLRQDEVESIWMLKLLSDELTYTPGLTISKVSADTYVALLEKIADELLARTDGHSIKKV